MKAIVVMFDSLNRRQLEPYGCDWTHAPNFRRLAERSATFDTSYVCSMPCMPARRDLHTGRPNFLHRSWGPLEPFDESVFDRLRQAGVYSHLVTDHYHYFEDGGCTYHTRYDTWQFFRGQEGDPWIGSVADPRVPDCVTPRDDHGRWRQDWVNRPHMQREHQHPQSRTFAAGLEFIRDNAHRDDWVLQIEVFDPHEPFFSHRSYQDRYAEHYDVYADRGGRHFDWPPYRRIEHETSEEVEHLRYEYAALVSMCDAKLGDVLDAMDAHDLWSDTMLVVCTDHGFMLGERESMGKMWLPLYDEVARTPLFIWDPRSRVAGERRSALVQPAIDLPVTLSGLFGVEPGPAMLGCDLADVVASDRTVRKAGLFGIHGGHVNVTDGRYVYMRGPVDVANTPLYEYTHMPTRMASRFGAEELQQVDLADAFSFTQDCPTMRIPATGGLPGGEKTPRDLQTKLFDTQADPGQRQPLRDPNVESRMVDHLVTAMRRCDAPTEQYQRLGLS